MHSPHRLAIVDIARTLALAAMGVFHFTYDLALFGFIDPLTMGRSFWILFAQAIAGTFIFLSGVSLVLASRAPLKPRKVMLRLAQIGGAAALVSVGTYVAMGDAFVRFGILHCLFVCAVLGIGFLRLPGMLWVLGGAAIVAVPHVLAWPVLAGTHWMWLGLTVDTPFMVDYVPLVPWLGVFLVGLGLARLVPDALWFKLEIGDTKAARALSWPGQHSLMIYLVHQPVLFGLVFAARWALG